MAEGRAAADRAQRDLYRLMAVEYWKIEASWRRYLYREVPLCRDSA